MDGGERRRRRSAPRRRPRRATWSAGTRPAGPACRCARLAAAIGRTVPGRSSSRGGVRDRGRPGLARGPGQRGIQPGDHVGGHRPRRRSPAQPGTAPRPGRPAPRGRRGTRRGGPAGELGGRAGSSSWSGSRSALASSGEVVELLRASGGLRRARSARCSSRHDSTSPLLSFGLSLRSSHCGRSLSVSTGPPRSAQVRSLVRTVRAGPDTGPDSTGVTWAASLGSVPSAGGCPLPDAATAPGPPGPAHSGTSPCPQRRR